MRHVPNTKVKIITPFIEASVDENSVERIIIAEHAGGDVYTNSIENVFSLFKRGLIGQYHKVSAKHLQRYLDECSYRFNRRKRGYIHRNGSQALRIPPLTLASLTSEEQTPF